MNVTKAMISCSVPSKITTTEAARVAVSRFRIVQGRRILTERDPESLEVFRHSSAHLLAAASLVKIHDDVGILDLKVARWIVEGDVPIDADAYEIDARMRRATLDGPGKAQIRVLEWGAQEKRLTAQVSEPTTLAVRLFNYPAWRVEVNGRTISAETHETTGVMVVTMGTGENEVQISFSRTSDRITGELISGLALLLVTAIMLRKRHTQVH